ncbi:MAG: transcriptional repressor [Geminicoccaceae bacterium]|nr:transcriptional repressor [Geminicoccaceae bacterium]
MERAKLGEAERHCAAQGERLTPLRRRVLEILQDAGQPLGAYAILEVLARDDRRRPLPPTVYRALDFLLAQGLAHKIHSQNAFLPCCAIGRVHTAELFVCRRCGVAREVPQDGEVARDERPPGFEVEAVVLEVRGVCGGCREPA